MTNLKLIKNVKFTLNSDGMTNVHPNIDTIESSDNSYTFIMTENEFIAYLFKNDIMAMSNKILDTDYFNYGSYEML